LPQSNVNIAPNCDADLPGLWVRSNHQRSVHIQNREIQPLCGQQQLILWSVKRFVLKQWLCCWTAIQILASVGVPYRSVRPTIMNSSWEILSLSYTTRRCSLANFFLLRCPFIMLNKSPSFSISYIYTRGYEPLIYGVILRSNLYLYGLLTTGILALGLNVLS
jgi:hypothetical protein